MSTVSDKIIVTTNFSTVNINYPMTVNKLNDMEILPLKIDKDKYACLAICKKMTTEISEIDSTKKGFASFLWFCSVAVMLIFLNRILHQTFQPDL